MGDYGSRVYALELAIKALTARPELIPVTPLSDSYPDPGKTGGERLVSLATTIHKYLYENK